MSGKQASKRQLQISRRRKIRALEAERDKQLVARDRASEALRGIRVKLREARLA